MFKKIIYTLLLVLLFLLPWQTRFMYSRAYVNGGLWEYGSQSWYATEILVWVIIVLSFFYSIRDTTIWERIKSPHYFKECRRTVVYSCIVLLYIVSLVLRSPMPQVSYQIIFWMLGIACVAIILISLSFRASPNGTTRDLDFSPLVTLGIRNDSAALLVALWLGGVGQGIFALWQFITQHVTANRWLGLASHLPYAFSGESVIEVGGIRWLRAYGSLPSPNILGGYLAVMFVVGLILYVQMGEGRKFSTSTWWNSILTVGQLFITTGLILSFSRSAWIGAVAGVVVLFVVGAIHELPLRVVIKPISFSLIAVLVLFVILKPLFLTRVEGAERLEVRSTSERIEQYQTWKTIFKNNWLLGVGPGMYTHALYETNPKLESWQYQPVHNTYFLILAEIGVVGFGLLLYFLVILFRFFWLHKNFVGLSLLVPIFIIALFDHYWWSLYSGIVLFGTVIQFALNVCMRKQD